MMSAQLSRSLLTPIDVPTTFASDPKGGSASGGGRFLGDGGRAGGGIGMEGKGEGESAAAEKGSGPTAKEKTKRGMIYSFRRSHNRPLLEATAAAIAPTSPDDEGEGATSEEDGTAEGAALVSVRETR